MAILIKEIVPSLLGSKLDWRTSLLVHWDMLVGSLKTRVCLEKIQDDMLVIGVYESHWMQELYLLSDVLIDSINQFLKEKRIKQLRFKLVEERKVPLKKNALRAIRPKSSAVVSLTPDQIKALSIISDDELKDALVQFWVRCKED